MNPADVIAARQTGNILGNVLVSILGTLLLVTVFWCIGLHICMQVSTCPLHKIYYKRSIQNLAEVPLMQDQPGAGESDVTTSHPPSSYHCDNT